MKNVELCSAAALQPFVRCLTQRGIKADRYLENQKIPPKLVDSGKGKIIKRQALRFFEEITYKEGLRTFGFLDNDPYSIHDLGSIGVALLKAVTLKDAIDTFSSLVSSFAEGNYIWLLQGPKVSWLCCYDENQDRTITAADQHTILILREVVRLAAGNRWQPKQVIFYSPPIKSLERIPELPGAELNYSHDFAGIAFETRLLTKPIIRKQQQLETRTISHMEPPAESTSEAISLVLVSFLKHRCLPTVNEIAESIGTSRMTLFRHLQKENTSYRQIVDRVRFKAAKNLLLNTSLTTKEISSELGYSHPNNFYRSFRRMSGVTTSQFRK